MDAIVVERQTLVIEAQQVQDGRVTIVTIDRILSSLPANVVGYSF
jgi:hypothetical protein